MHEYMPGDIMLASDLTEAGTATGGTRPCSLEGCNGVRVGVRWEDGKISWPCSKGIVPVKFPSKFFSSPVRVYYIKRVPL